MTTPAKDMIHRLWARKKVKDAIEPS